MEVNLKMKNIEPIYDMITWDKPEEVQKKE